MLVIFAGLGLSVLMWLLLPTERLQLQNPVYESFTRTQTEFL